MCISLGTLAAVAGILGGAASVYGAVTAKGPEAPQLPTPAKPPQAAQAPDVGVLKKRAQGQGDSTLLTGPGGVTSDSLLLGKSTLLGM